MNEEEMDLVGQMSKKVEIVGIKINHVFHPVSMFGGHIDLGVRKRRDIFAYWWRFSDKFVAIDRIAIWL